MSGSSFAVAAVRRLFKTSAVEVDAVGLSKCEKPVHFFLPSPSQKRLLENRVEGDSQICGKSFASRVTCQQNYQSFRGRGVIVSRNSGWPAGACTPGRLHAFCAWGSFLICCTPTTSTP
jgi:hypothetical protein